ncbi:hypothetical protein Q4603_21820 [Zobellia galactanivorans]|uniref:hypothetical protein n=1 Tax=Zobellia galactanivorans (strain DSM 12802 / CCUG 47099 / CIP 106680 / NCIMB 13871 / Dsij) TaxID=63186 RepID=UPI0026E1460A|nr:hypothetical protein [Zobellia galactanivorans]MDO6811270.1 hypothetical protein [Zobellia galactanivorans]
MEFSFEYFDILKSINSNIGSIKLMAYGGILLLYIPYWLLLKLFKQDTTGKMNSLGLLYFILTWLMSGFTIGILCQDETSGIKLFLVFISIITVNLIFVLNNHSRLYKVYHKNIQEMAGLE